MKKLIVLFISMLSLVLCSCSNVGTDNDKTSELADINNKDLLEQYENVKKIKANYLYEHPDKYKGKNVMTVATIADASGGEIKFKTDNNKDGLFFSFVCNFKDENVADNVEIDSKICFVGKVDSAAAIGNTVTINDCSLIASGSSVGNYESQLKADKDKKDGKNGKKKKKKKTNASDKKAYMNSCSVLPYGKIKRSPDKYKGKKAKLTGKVLQVDEGWFDGVSLRVEDSSGNDWYVSYTYPDGSDKILENDKITVYGECDGTEEYQTIIGDSRRIPSISAEYIK